MGPVFKNVGERSTAENYSPVNLFSVVSKVFEKLESKRIVDHLEKYGLFLIFSMVFSVSGYIDVKMVGSVLEEKSSFKMLGLTFSSKLD